MTVKRNLTRKKREDSDEFFFRPILQADNRNSDMNQFTVAVCQFVRIEYLWRFRFRWFSRVVHYYLSYDWTKWNWTAMKWCYRGALMRSYQCPLELYTIATHRPSVFYPLAYRHANTIHNYLQTHRNGTRQIHGSKSENDGECAINSG